MTSLWKDASLYHSGDEFRKKKPWVIDRSKRDGTMENGANDDKTLY